MKLDELLDTTRIATHQGRITCRELAAKLGFPNEGSSTLRGIESFNPASGPKCNSILMPPDGAQPRVSPADRSYDKTSGKMSLADSLPDDNLVDNWLI